MRRCLETTKAIWKSMQIITDDRLLEFNYGHAEGLHYDELVTKYPEILSGWEKGEDPRFPEGENTKDVFNRLTSFLEDLTKETNFQNTGPIYIVTHNGVLRCLLGNAFRLRQKDWYKLVIPHGVSLQFMFFQNHFHPNISRKLWADIMQNIGYSTA